MNSKFFINNEKRPFLNYTFNKIQKKGFFLKYMQNRGWIPDPSQKASKKVEGIDIKALLDEKNVKINISDILTDYKYFKREYYSIDFHREHEKKTLPFDSKSISWKNVIEYFFIKV